MTCLHYIHIWCYYYSLMWIVITRMDVMMLLDLKMPSETFVCVNVSSKMWAWRVRLCQLYLQLLHRTFALKVNASVFYYYHMLLRLKSSFVSRSVKPWWSLRCGVTLCIIRALHVHRVCAVVSRQSGLIFKSTSLFSLPCCRSTLI